MSENINITCNILNETGNHLTVAAKSLSWGKWQSVPVNLSKSNSGQKAFKAYGRKSSASGTTGTVTYEVFDGTQFKIDFDIKWGNEANEISSSMPTGHGNPSNFIFMRTKSDYSTPETSGDPGSSPVTVYYLIKKK